MDNQPGFVGVSSLMKEKVLLPRDVAVFKAIEERVNWRTGMCEYTLKALADEIGMDSKYVINSVSRLKKAHLVLNQRDETNGRRYILLNPYYVWSGDARHQSKVEQIWASAWRRENPEEVLDGIDDYEAQAKVEEHNRRVDAVNRWKARNEKVLASVNASV